MTGFQRTLGSLTDPDLAADTIDGLTLVGIIVTSAYTFDPTHAIATDVTTWETAASAYARLAGTVEVTVDSVQNAVLVALEDITTGTDLSDEPAQGGIAWFTPGPGKYVGFSADTSGSGSDTYSPTYPDGLYDESAADTATVTVDGGDR